MLRGKIRSGKITGPVQNYPALSMVFGDFEVFKSTESEADPASLECQTYRNAAPIAASTSLAPPKTVPPNKCVAPGPMRSAHGKARLAWGQP